MTDGMVTGKWKSRIWENPDSETETDLEAVRSTGSATGSDTGSVLFYFLFILLLLLFFTSYFLLLPIV